ncbi:MAG: glycogen synthase, partial [Candidatus Woesearchaeota archaeon]|nr:glycogen synthase [Candidatus Woesearchaeota archaeon]
MAADYFFEISWEVCNKVGGIYTVITSKVQQMLQAYKFNYYTIGPFFPGKNTAGEFQQKEPPEFLKNAFEELHRMGITCIYGTWLTDGEPSTILIDYSGYKYKINDIKKEYWDMFKIDSLHSQFHDYDEPMLWSTCVGVLLEKIKIQLGEKKIAAQTHEWLAGGALLYIKSRKIRIGTIFTTHATMLGRTLAANDFDLYDKLDKINPEEMAYKYGIPEKFLTERACAQNSDVFTTVSEITGMEATAFFGRKPDVLLFNGIDTHVFPTFDEASIQHKALKEKLKKFLMFYFFPYYQFDLDETLIFFLAGRYEFKNKGIDMYIDALAKLNEELKKAGSPRTVVAFIWVPAGIKEIKPELIESRSYFEDMYDSIHDLLEDVKDRMIY